MDTHVCIPAFIVIMNQGKIQVFCTRAKSDFTLIFLLPNPMESVSSLLWNTYM